MSGRFFTLNDFADPTKNDNKQGINIHAKTAEMKLINYAKEAARNTKKLKGNIKCPKCEKNMLFEYVKELDKFLLECTTEDCIKIDELG